MRGSSERDMKIRESRHSLKKTQTNDYKESIGVGRKVLRLCRRGANEF
jgi:hypothetical protein